MGPALQREARRPGPERSSPSVWRACYSYSLMSEDRYVFGEDAGSEAERLGAVERAFDVQSQNVLLEVGVRAGWSCWEVGAGRGSIARWLSVVVGSDGQVLATDLDDRWFDPARTGIAFRRHDVVRDSAPGHAFDLVHARFVLEHLPDPRAVIARLAESLRPGGVLVLEDSAGLGLEVTPSTPLFDHLAKPWKQAGAAVGWNASYGSLLMSDLRTTGLVELGGRQYRQLACGGEAWAHVARGIQRMETELIAQGVTPEQLAAALRCLVDPANVITGPPVTIAWGRRAGA
jgi:SAM-dependent methyltransferase